ncbi:MAG: 5'-nucleotidase, lipoprotein e(P4) family [Alphaproteobacteria bacterium]|nr:5'-nucleotidase, lipoprotein e(P4) family [Alphaproteobacteria bacterium]
MRLGLVMLLCVVASGLAQAQNAPAVPSDTAPFASVERVTGHDHLNAIAWHQSSAEFEATARMAFAMARVALDAALKDKTRSALPDQQSKGGYADLPPAIITDVDETILDNGPFQGTLMKEQPQRPAGVWADWVELAIAKPIPGADEFLRYAQDRGVTIFFITNRNSEKELATKKNLEAIGIKFPSDFDTLFLDRERPEWRGDKALRRAAAATTHRILLLLGDDFGDFTSSYNKPTADRRAVAQAEAVRWGRDWIILSNPIYGSWENALIEFNFRMPPAERRKMKWDAVETAPTGSR